ncbi:uncharacterized protein L969DRAFT_52118 [Mixia osmundae IAM 14324]|uniref:At2g23090-like zinc-binding domain-containing protein n=1 Tax=Mixia osmundae (strain CBS 9802 / IAM 14324 / JCM 22182 / KY 12970) TaxID=764103 RepID=G7EAC1_MIXOS|nr:uncharacterized protein L969DRAFT_52118 [Mixia osmundae IAM 14324]KEI37840.1 hypothetical protein L969DRAFT_52118 [Mixia osmundae IAM 14324]GAA99781.1 hypothetical protein E5Q_06484 [Mixia osmundae IAM 14324]
MGGGNGAKSAEARKRAEAKAKSNAGGKSQLKSNAASLTIQCKTCLQTFQQTTKAPMLEEHAQNRHSKGLKDCFPTFVTA